MKSVGIDIGNFSVKLAEIEASSSAYSLRRFEEYAFSPDPQRDRQLQLIEILRAIAALYDAGSARFTIALPQHLSSGRLRRFPFRERPKILKSLPFELEDDIPLDPEETIFDAKIVEFVGNAAQAWCVAAPREAVRETLKSSLEGSIDPDIVCLEGLALANLFERWQLPPAEIPPERAAMFALAASADDAATAALPERPARVILALGHVRTLVLIYRDGSLCSARSIQWGGQEIANSIASVFNVPYYEALKVLQTKSFILLKKEGATRDQIGLSKAISDSVDNLIRPLKLALLESKSELGLAYNEIELLGGASQIQHLAPYLTNALEIPCNLALPLASLRGMTIPDTPQTQASSAVAVGLAIEGLKRPRNPPLNLRRGELARENQNLKRLWRSGARRRKSLRAPLR